MLYKDRARVGDGAIRRLAAKCDPVLLDRVARADCMGRAPGHFPPDAMDWFIGKVRELSVLERPPAPLLLGRHVLELGVAPGPEVGRVVKAVYELQLDGEVTTEDEARSAARRILAKVD
jgi:tRNA nucleotidyltransferase (CCA-adding enzyme)